MNRREDRHDARKKTMRKIASIALAAAAAIATPAMAQNASGTVQVGGSVLGKCSAITPITGSITLNELALADGTVNTTFSNQTGGLSRSFTVICTSANVSISVSSDALNNGADQTTGGGYTGQVHYTSTLTANKAGGGSASAVYTSAAVLPAATTTPLADRLQNGASNVTVTVSNGHTANSADLLKAGSYSSTISITISPV
jgi:hypothetical protein